MLGWRPLLGADPPSLVCQGAARGSKVAALRSHSDSCQKRPLVMRGPCDPSFSPKDSSAQRWPGRPKPSQRERTLNRESKLLSGERHDYHAHTYQLLVVGKLLNLYQSVVVSARKATRNMTRPLPHLHWPQWLKAGA